MAGSILLTSCGSKDSAASGSTEQRAANSTGSGSDAEAEYRRIKTELKLAEGDKPYLVLNLKRKWIEIRLKGALVWEYPLDLIDTDDDDISGFSEDFLGQKATLVRPITEKHLFASKTLTPDSILAIISEATNVDAELLQRQLPSRFQILWSGGLTLDVRTDVEGEAKSKFQNTLADIKQVIARPLGRSIIIVKMPKEAALTLYRASIPGLPTMIVPT